jgi:hypothetical protein
MDKGMLYKTIVICIISIFIGVSVQPAFANENIITESEDEKKCDCKENINFKDIIVNKKFYENKEIFENCGNITRCVLLYIRFNYVLKAMELVLTFLNRLFNDYTWFLNTIYFTYIFRIWIILYEAEKLGCWWYPPY